MRSFAIALIVAFLGRGESAAQAGARPVRYSISAV
jgi:hypothetical protein